MPTWLKITLSLLGSFLGGVTGAYQLKPDAGWLPMIMAGAAAIVPYLVGFYQINPANQPK